VRHGHAAQEPVQVLARRAKLALFVPQLERGVDRVAVVDLEDADALQREVAACEDGSSAWRAGERRRAGGRGTHEMYVTRMKMAT